MASAAMEIGGKALEKQLQIMEEQQQKASEFVDSRVWAYTKYFLALYCVLSNYHLLYNKKIPPPPPSTIHSP